MTVLEEIKQAEVQATALIEQAHTKAQTDLAVAEANLRTTAQEEERRLQTWLATERATARRDAEAAAIALQKDAERERAELTTQVKALHDQAVIATAQAYDRLTKREKS